MRDKFSFPIVRYRSRGLRTDIQMLNRMISIVLVLAFLVQGCAAQIIDERVRKGPLVREEGTGTFSVRTRKEGIELVTPLKVRVFEEVEREEDTRRYFQKVRVLTQARPRKYPLFDAWIKLLLSVSVVPLALPSFWVEGSYAGTNCRAEPEACTVQNINRPVRGAYFVERGASTTVERQAVGTGAFVSLYINGRYQGDLPLDRSGTASVDLRKYFDMMHLNGDTIITFKYRSAYAYSRLSRGEILKLTEESALAPRQ